MFLKSLQIQGFKSFPDRVVIKFVDGITAVVGPNGSGKSNISDAVRWVLGEKSPRVLRIKQSEDVIFGGTDTRKPQGFAEVVLTFDNADRALNVDADEVAVLRRYYRSGKSEFKINGMSVRLQDIHELLMDTGLGKGGYSIIGQGKISEIVESRSDERRIVFEEAAGISKFRHRKHETERNLERAQENLTHLEVILTGYEERVGPLEREAEKAKKYLELLDEKKSVEISVWLSTLERSTSQLRDFEYKITLINSQGEEAATAIEQCEADIAALFQESNGLAAQKEAVLEQASHLDEQAIHADGDSALLGNDREHNLSSIERLKAELVQMSQDDEGLSAEIEAKRGEISTRRGRLSELEDSQTALRNELESLHGQLSGYGSELDSLFARQNQTALAISEGNIRLSTSDAQIEELRTRAQEAAGIIERAQTQADKIRSEIDETNEAIGAAEEKITELTNAVGGYRLRLEKQRARLDAARLETERLERESRDIESKARMLEDLERNLEGFGFSVKKIMTSAQNGQVRGIHGPVSRLIKVDGEYAVAVEIALGGNMQSIVVDNEEDGKRAIAFLKRENAGRATFLPLTTIKANRLSESGLATCEGFVGMASELVECDAKYRAIVDNLLGRIAVAEDMDAAVAIARRFSFRFRIVTLDGQVVNAGGSMTGGSLSKNAGLLSRRGDIEKLRAQAESKKQEAAVARENQKSLQTKVSSDEAALIGSQGELATAQEDLVGFRADLRILTEQLEQLERECKSHESLSRASLERADFLEHELETLRRQVASLEEESRQLNKQISEQSGRREELSTRREQLTSLISDAGIECIAVTKEIEALEASIAEINSRRGMQSQRINDIHLQIEQLNEQNLQIDEKIAQCQSAAQDYRAQAKSIRDSIADISRMRDEMEIKMNELRKRSRELTEQRDGISRESVRLEERRNTLRQQYDAIIAAMMETYNLTRSEAELEFEPAEDIRKAEKRLQELKSSIRRLEPVNVSAIEEYAEVSEKYLFYKSQIEDALKAKAELEKMITQLTEQMKTMFAEKFVQINEYFGEIFTELFGGGRANLTLTDETDPLNCGIDIDAQPPGKKVRVLESLSGGEKSIVAVAIYFAIMKVNPSPFCFLDEVDSALDEANVSNIAQYIQRMSDRTQYIAITHRRGTMEVANMLYGVTMQNDGESKVLELNLSEIEEKLGIN